MEETDPAQLVPAKKPISEPNGSGSVGMTPMAPMGMPMSPRQPAQDGDPGPPPRTDSEAIPSESQAEPFGSPAVHLTHEPMTFHALTSSTPGTPATPLVPQEFHRLEPAIPAAVPLEPHILPVRADSPQRPAEPVVDDCCTCCGDSHDGQEGREFTRGEHPAGDHGDRPEYTPQHVIRDDAPGDVPRGEVTEPVPTEEKPDSCCCCGDEHRFDRARSDDQPNTEGVVTDPEDSEDPEDSHDHCGDDDKPGGDKPGGDKPGDTPGGDTHPGEPAGDKDPGLPPTQSNSGGKVPLTPGRGNESQRPVTDDSDSCKPHQKLLPQKETTNKPGAGQETPTDRGYAVRMPDAKRNTPGETMAPPVRSSRPAETTSGTPSKQGTVPLQPARSVKPMRRLVEPTKPNVPAGVPVTPGQPGEPPKNVPAGIETPEGTVTVPATVPTEQGVRDPMPLAPVTATPAKTVLAQTQPGPGNTNHVPSQPGTPAVPPVPPVVTNGGNQGGGQGTNNPYNIFGTTGNGNTGAPPQSGNVGPDPNIKFDEAQYTQLIAVLGEVVTTLRTSRTTDNTTLDIELALQPSGQNWEPARLLVQRGTGFGDSVDTQSRQLGKTLETFHESLEQAKEVFKETDDLAAYDATKFTTNYPGINGGGLPGGGA